MGIGGVIIAVTFDNDGPAIAVNECYQRFFTRGQAEVVLRVHYQDLPRPKLEEKSFDAETAWKMFRSNNEYVLQIPSAMAILKSDFTSGEIFIKAKDTRTSFPLGYPLGEIILMSLLARGRGMMVHACGVKDDKKGWLFVGTSRAGKSTTANLWEKEKDSAVLSDDRIIIRSSEGKFWMYGTPWHGEARACSPERALLERVFFLKHAKRNTMKSMSPIEIVSRLIISSFPTFWDKKGMEFTLKFCAELAQRVPCYELGFVPDKSAIDFVRSNG